MKQKQEKKPQNDLKTKIHQCPLCINNYSHFQSLKRHKKVHNSKKKNLPFFCNTCNQSFNCKDKLERHELAHTRKQLFHCNIRCSGCNTICKRKFRKKANLRPHSKSGHKFCNHCNVVTKCNAKCLICNAKCSKAFKRKDKLIQHKKKCCHICKTCLKK